MMNMIAPQAAATPAGLQQQAPQPAVVQDASAKSALQTPAQFKLSTSGLSGSYASLFAANDGLQNQISQAQQAGVANTQRIARIKSELSTI